MTNPKVEEFLSKEKKWKLEFEELRKIALEFELTEDFKWMHPCYTHDKKNIVLIHGFKEYCAILFPKGALLKDKHGLLIQQTENVQSARQIRFTNVKEILDQKDAIKDYIEAAIQVEESGQKVEIKKTEDYPVPEELQQKFEEMEGLKTAFEALTPGRQRAYIFHFSGAKQSKTRTARIEKYIPQILDGKGMND
ncbi:YdeI/OmpD-associated family protein [Sutcliffiella rhizosphaerae]|uniref:YdhG-like domain-containing protein n=1 Tax=Sutcliffiella rhizosphaerae TaxID=2880967 RepID=A0ABN8A5M7_9BACI|nr:YdeI family protein [Sutcliffiella rhizosphaerae]CAG9620416.1 hypothetical protein BACCIP111883_01184 [Sutcliffiella rhizosphaerae]